MTKRIRTNDILIGEDRWIESIELKGGHSDAVEIDPLLIGLSSMWSLLEVHCVAGCCGLEAFDFFPESIATASKRMDLFDLNSSLTNAIQDIEDLSTELVRSTRLNNLADKKMFLALLHHIRSCVPTAY